MEKMNGIKTAQFTLSLPGSEASSRASSPDLPEHTRNVANHAPARTTYNHNDLTTKYIDNIVPGRQGRDVYDTNLSWWRAGVRRKLVEMVQWESVVIAKMQVGVATITIESGRKICRFCLDELAVKPRSLK